MNHYTYLLTFSNGMKYIGVRSTKLKPELDTCYLGSGRYLPEDRDCIKTILNTYPSRKEAVQAETAFIIENNCVNSDSWYNQRSWNYDKHGQTKETNTSVAKIAHKLTGRRKEDYEYIRKANLKRKKYVGDNRTPAQKEGHKSMVIKNTGVKNPAKGHKGTTNCAFKPWFYITDSGQLTIVTDETKQDYAHRIGLTPRQIVHRFHHTNINKPVKQGVCKGWIFGNLEDLERVQSNELD